MKSRRRDKVVRLIGERFRYEETRRDGALQKGLQHDSEILVCLRDRHRTCTGTSERVTKAAAYSSASCTDPNPSTRTQRETF